jgi:WD40 repeat protein
MLFSGSEDGTIKVWSLMEGAYQEEQTLTRQSGFSDSLGTIYSSALMALALDPTSWTLFSGSYVGITLWRLK